MSTGELVLLRRSLSQPDPAWVDGGDCGACVLAGLLDIPLERIYQVAMPIPREKPYSLWWDNTVRVLRWAQGEGLLDRYIDRVPLWPAEGKWLWNGLTAGWHMASPWFDYVRMAMEAGYYALALVSHEKQAGIRAGPDHWVLLAGCREFPEEYDDGTGPYVIQRPQVLVSCSSRSTPAEEWVSHYDFLRERGGFNVILARPSARIEIT
jgi:hypothetical protein